MRFRPKKYLGQNFLVDKNIQKKIILACEITSRDTVLEIGAGRGELTRLIAEKTNHVFALELDSYLCSILANNLKDYPQLKIINNDILCFNILRHFKDAPKIKIIGNLPYNITTQIIVHILKFRDKIKDIFVTVQKEYAQRMVAHPGQSEWSSFSCFLQYYTDPQMLFLIKKTCFKPKPKVDSALLKLSIREGPFLDKKREKQLFKIIRLSFQQRRKTLRNALSGAISNKSLERYFDKFSIDRNIRGERLSLQDFINLVDISGVASRE